MLSFLSPIHQVLLLPAFSTEIDNFYSIQGGLNYLYSIVVDKECNGYPSGKFINKNKLQNYTKDRYTNFSYSAVAKKNTMTNKVMDEKGNGLIPSNGIGTIPFDARRKKTANYQVFLDTNRNVFLKTVSNREWFLLQTNIVKIIPDNYLLLLTTTGEVLLYDWIENQAKSVVTCTKLSFGEKIKNMVKEENLPNSPYIFISVTGNVYIGTTKRNFKNTIDRYSDRDFGFKPFVIRKDIKLGEGTYDIIFHQYNVFLVNNEGKLYFLNSDFFLRTNKNLNSDWFEPIVTPEPIAQVICNISYILLLTRSGKVYTYKPITNINKPIEKAFELLDFTEPIISIEESRSKSEVLALTSTGKLYITKLESYRCRYSCYLKEDNTSFDVRVENRIIPFQHIVIGMIKDLVGVYDLNFIEIFEIYRCLVSKNQSMCDFKEVESSMQKEYNIIVRQSYILNL